ncbi:regulatory protein RecX [Cellulomonas denverensis]|nr:regulatory protein RecX [Cellulomonas denverensis]
MSLDDLAGLLVPASALNRPSGSTVEGSDHPGPEAAVRAVLTTASQSHPGPEGKAPAPGTRRTARNRPTPATEPPTAGRAPMDAEPGLERAPDDAPARAGRRRATRNRLAPATEPPTTGSAAVDAEADPEAVARTIVLRQLTAAPRSRHQLAEALARREVPEDVADRVLDRFTEVGLIDDAAYAEMLVRSRHAERGLSRRALTMELRRKGVSPEDSATALDQVGDDDEEQAARALVRKKLRATRGLDREVRMRRAYGALGRKGYGPGLVARLVREELAAEEDGTADD